MAKLSNIEKVSEVEENETDRKAGKIYFYI